MTASMERLGREGPIHSASASEKGYLMAMLSDKIQLWDLCELTTRKDPGRGEMLLMLTYDYCSPTALET